MPTVSVAVEEAFALTSRVTVVRLRAGSRPHPLRGQDVKLATPGREPLSATVTGLTFLDSQGDAKGVALAVALVLCGAAVSDVPPGTLIMFEWDGGVWGGLGNADYEAGVRDALRRALEDEGYRVSAAPGGAALCIEAEGRNELTGTRPSPGRSEAPDVGSERP